MPRRLGHLFRRSHNLVVRKEKRGAQRLRVELESNEEALRLAVCHRLVWMTNEKLEWSGRKYDGKAVRRAGSRKRTGRILELEGQLHRMDEKSFLSESI